MRRCSIFPLCLIASLLACALALFVPRLATATDPVPSFNFLTTGNGHGFQIFDTNPSKRRITQFLEHPYRYLRPGRDPRGEGVVRRNLAYDAYLGLRGGGVSGWLPQAQQLEIGYLEESGIIRQVATQGSLRAESYFFAPQGYAGNAMVMVLKLTNQGAAATDASGFAIFNFHMGSAPTPDSPGADGESLTYDPARGLAVETGPGGGAMLYAAIGGADHADCGAGAYDAVQAGRDIGDTHTCNRNDVIEVFQQGLGSVEPGASAWFGVAVIFQEETAAVDSTFQSWQSFLAGRSAERLLEDARSEWQSWRKSPPAGVQLSPDELRVWRQSEAVLRMGQVTEAYSESPKRKNHGMVLASLPPGGWHSGWVRDAMYALVALARSGHASEARAGLNFFLNAEAGKYASYVGGPYRISVVRYFGNGEEEADYSGQPSPNIEIDGWGMYLWAARVYVDASGDAAWLSGQTRAGEEVYTILRTLVADPMERNLEVNGLAKADASIWEVHWDNRRHYTYTSLAMARGFCDMAALAKRMGRQDEAAHYRDLSARAVQAIGAALVDQEGALVGSLEELSTGQYRDGAPVEAITWNLFPPGERIAQATLDAFSYLLTPAGGYKRNDDNLSSYDSNEWILIDLRAADAMRRAGRAPRADELISWVTRQARVNFNLLPELYNAISSEGTIGAYTGSIPMVGYGAGAYLLTLIDRAGILEASDCGTVDPPPPPADGGPPPGDGGPPPPPSEGGPPPPPSDGGPVAGGDAALPPGYTGFACLCHLETGRGSGSGEAGFSAGWMLAAIAIPLAGRRLVRRLRSQPERKATGSHEDAMECQVMIDDPPTGPERRPACTRAPAGRRAGPVSLLALLLALVPFAVCLLAVPRSATAVEFEFHGYSRMPLNLEPTPRSPYLVDADYYRSGFAYTRLYEGDWTELYLSASGSNLRFQVLLFASLYSDSAQPQIDRQYGIAQANLTWSQVAGVKPLTLAGGVFWERLGYIEPYDTYMFGRTHQLGIKASWDFANGAQVALGAGAHIEFLQANQGLTPLIWAYGFVPIRRARLGLYLLDSFTRDERQLSPIQSANLLVVGTDLRVPTPVGEVYAAFSYSNADQSMFLAPAIELLHSAGGRGLTENYFGTEKSNNGTGALFAFALDFRGRWRKLSTDLFGMLVYALSDQKSDDPLVNRDRRTYFKWGIEPGYLVLPWLRPSIRYDRVILNIMDGDNGFRVLSPRLTFIIKALKGAQFWFMYSHYFYGPKVELRPGQVPLVTKPDENVFKLQAQVSW